MRAFLIVMSVGVAFAMPSPVHDYLTAVGPGISLAVTDLATDTTYSHDDNAVVNPASVIKVPILLAYLHQIQSGVLSGDEMALLRREDIQPGAGTLRYRSPGESIRLDELAELMIRHSDNTATLLVIRFLGLATINGYMQSWGLSDSILKTGRLLDDVPENTMSVRDIQRLLVRLSRYEILTPVLTQRALQLLGSQKYRWGLPKRLPGFVRVSNKTGTLTGFRHDVGVIVSDSAAYVVSIFTTGLSKSKASEVIATLSDLVYTDLISKK